MSVSFFLKGLAIGFSIAAPVGAIGVLCIKRTLTQGQLAGFVSGLGAATADGLYGCIAGFGLTFISRFLTAQQFWLRLIGGVFLCYLGVKTFLDKPAKETISVNKSSLLNVYLSTFFLTLINPSTILSFAAIFAGLGLTNTIYRSAALLITGVFLGSAAWWLILSSGVSLLRLKLTPRILKLINGASGLVLIVFGLLALLK